jgi:hypothetical protein
MRILAQMNIAMFCEAACMIAAITVKTAAMYSVLIRPSRSANGPKMKLESAPPIQIADVFKARVAVFRAKYSLYDGSIFSPFLGAELG